jgi:hypothetical protein
MKRGIYIRLIHAVYGSLLYIANFRDFGGSLGSSIHTWTANDADFGTLGQCSPHPKADLFNDLSNLIEQFRS